MDDMISKKEIGVMDNTSLENGESAHEVIDPVVERSIKRKADFILLPMLALMYLFKYAKFTSPCSLKTKF